MYRLYNDDFRNVISQMGNCSVDLIVTDPPYKVTPRGNAGNAGGMLQKEIRRIYTRAIQSTKGRFSLLYND